MGKDTPPTSSDMDEQLEYLFAESESPEADPEADSQSAPLRELKALFLAVDWEINDEIMSALLRQIESLQKVYKDDRIILLFLQLLSAVGKYVKASKANAHPDAVKLLNSIYTSLEIVSMSEGMTDAERKKILRAEVNRFKRLKEALAKKAALEKPASRPPSAKVPEAPSGEVPPALRYVLEELKKVIREEFAALRSELKQR